jgi:hypothetical protein
MIQTKDPWKRRLLKWLMMRVCRWDRLAVVMFALESMPYQQRVDALGYILCTYYPKQHLHRNPVRKKEEAA